jgi:hypothetical protein
MIWRITKEYWRCISRQTVFHDISYYNIESTTIVHYQNLVFLQSITGFTQDCLKNTTLCNKLSLKEIVLFIVTAAIISNSVNIICKLQYLVCSSLQQKNKHLWITHFNAMCRTILIGTGYASQHTI